MTIQNPAIIPPRVDFLDPRTGKISREWFLFLINNYDLVNPANGTIADAFTQLAFTNDNTSDIADLQWQIDHLDLGGDPLVMTNGEIEAVSKRVTGVQTEMAFMPSSPKPFPTWWQQRNTIYSGEVMSIDSGYQIMFSLNLTNNGSINNSGILAVI